MEKWINTITDLVINHSEAIDLITETLKTQSNLILFLVIWNALISAILIYLLIKKLKHND